MSTFRPALLREHRTAAGLSREDLAAIIGRGYFAVASYEQGVTSPPLPILERIAEACEVPVSAYFEESAA